ncbi:hypothetical protein V6B08_11685 [Ferrovibrio sp. MS7]|uniref:hypothetical protein n=1 Tax=Ferrovibrio plantarum TaxID=3119164 RepID=UPI00313760FD
MLHKWILSAVALPVSVLLVSPEAKALTIGAAEFTCPLTNEKFVAQSVASGTSFGARLDLRRIGPIASPWPLVKCPDSGLPLFERDFSPETVAYLKAYTATEEYRKLRAEHADYYVTAKLQSGLGYAPDKIMFSILSAAWEVEGKNAALEKIYLTEAREHILALLQAMPHSEERWPTYYFLSVELSRRLGMFDEADNRLKAERARLAGSIPADFMELQAKLIETRETKPDAPYYHRQTKN